MSDRSNAWCGAMIAPLLALVLMGRDVSAQVMSAPKTSIGTIAPTTTLALYAKISSFEITGTTKPNEQAAFKIAVPTSGGTTRNVAWQVGVPGGAVLASGTLAAAAPGNTYAVTGHWTTTAGAFAIVATLDPSTTSGESGQALADHRSPPVTRVYSDWPKWMQAAVDAMRSGGTQWVADMRLSDVRVNGPMAVGGKLTGNDFLGYVRPAMIAGGAPPFVADAVLKPVADALNRWRGSVTLPATGLPWYPSLACVAASNAPPTTNIPTSLVTLVQNPTPLDPYTVSSDMRVRLGPAANWPGGNAIDGFARTIASTFTAWLPRAQIMLVMGSGPVPTYGGPLAPQGPCAPVVNGTATSGNTSPLLTQAQVFGLLPYLP